MPNRLADEPSPYLQQHKDNPVDWYPWGEEAFEAAKEADKPLFVSIGYATCHWCHVMERESFEDDEIASLMNQAFVNVKVDREERPDVDSIYMTVCQMLTGQGGWPLNVILTPDRKPIFAGTYIPPTSKHGRIGMRELVPRLQRIWQSERDRMETSAQEITDFLQKDASGDLSADTPGDSALKEAATLLEREFDAVHHGFGRAPKFPMPHYVNLLLRHWKATGSEKSLDMASKTLGAMARGGIYDHIGFGFHRYSTDARWLLPHFEKMLYDQALLLDAYLEAFEATGDSDFGQVAREIARYVRRDMTSREGGFFSAEDADSEGVEGKFYVWTADELSSILGQEDAELAKSAFNATEAGNYLEEATGERTGANILHRSGADSLKRDSSLESIRERLLAARGRRIRPLLDDKILTDWNGLMIASLARAGVVLDDSALTAAAERAAEFVVEHLMEEDDGKVRLLHRYRDGQSGIRANLDDHAFLALGCFELFTANQDARWLEISLALTEQMLDDFLDEERGGLFFAPSDGQPLIVRRKEIQDGAVPSGLSKAVLNLARLGRLLRRDNLLEHASAAGASVGKSIARYPTAHTALLCALGHLHGDGGEVVVAGSAGDPETAEMLRAARSGFEPYRLVVHVDPEKDPNPLFEIAPHFSDYKPIKGKPAAYVCQDFVCESPTNEIDVLREQLGIGSEG